MTLSLLLDLPLARLLPPTTTTPGAYYRFIATLPPLAAREVIPLPGDRAWRERNKARLWTESIEGVSEETRRTYGGKALSAVARIRTFGYKETLPHLPAEAVERLLRETSLAPTTRAYYGFALRGFLLYLKNPVATRKRVWRSPRPSRRAPAGRRSPRWPRSSITRATRRRGSASRSSSAA